MFSYIAFLSRLPGELISPKSNHKCHFGHRGIADSTYLLFILKHFHFQNRGQELGLWLQIAWVLKETLPLTTLLDF